MGLLVTVGAESLASFDEEKLQELLADDRVWGVALPTLDETLSVAADVQQRVFSACAVQATAAGKTIVLTSGNQADVQLALLRQAQVDFGRVALINNTLGAEQQQPWLDAGCYIAFDGSVTYPDQVALREAAKATPLSRMLCASNQPYVTPSAIAQVPGGIEDVVWVVGEIIELKLAFGREAFMEVYDALFENAKSVLGLKR